MRGRLTSRVMFASGLLVVLVSTAFAVLLFAVDDMRDSARRARHSRTELVAANQVEKYVIDLETGERGFVITRKESFLGPWHEARRRIPVETQRLINLTDDPQQRRRASAIASSVSSYVRHYSVPLVELVRSGDPAATSVAVTAHGKRLVDSIRGRFDNFVDSERKLATTLQGDADANARHAVIAASVGLVGSFVLVALFASYIARAIALPVRRAATMAKRLAGGDLSVRMPETGAGEIGDLERAFNTMGGALESTDAELRRVADEQAALRRVATLVARGVPPDQLLKRVVGEVGGLIDADATALLRYEPDGAATSLAEWSQKGQPAQLGRVTLDEDSISARVLATGQAATKASYGGAEGSLEARTSVRGIRSSVAAPIVVAGRLWGVMIASWTEERPASPEIQARMAEFIELVATAIANAEGRAELTASRARVVAAADETRRRIERDLHDGTQQRLISVGLEMRAAEAEVPPELTELKAQLASAGKSLTGAVEELQEISRGIHPAILTRGGLKPALKTLARRSAVPVDLHVSDDGPLPRPLEVAAYYVVSEALTNAAKHSSATALTVDMSADNGVVRLSITDDGVGGADPSLGSGLVGLKDRVEALGGKLEIASTRGDGTALRATIPIPPAE